MCADLPSVEARYEETAGFLGRHPGLFRFLCFVSGFVTGFIVKAIW